MTHTMMRSCTRPTKSCSNSRRSARHLLSRFQRWQSVWIRRSCTSTTWRTSTKRLAPTRRTSAWPSLAWRRRSSRSWPGRARSRLTSTLTTTKSFTRRTKQATDEQVHIRASFPLKIVPRLQHRSADMTTPVVKRAGAISFETAFTTLKTSLPDTTLLAAVTRLLASRTSPFPLNNSSRSSHSLSLAFSSPES